ncbi:hypothetical protein TNCT_258201 [Trichonephila clavata]|uniref:Uncharacterized protein n=1 Tax=Trichonephila clavata TaxID=2740835 RepID=A0A8X6J2W3_TRICU|nr:hypothetical protein TNCT_258201 [Trichonephila clavata]
MEPVLKAEINVVEKFPITPYLLVPPKQNETPLPPLTTHKNSKDPSPELNPQQTYGVGQRKTPLMPHNDDIEKSQDYYHRKYPILDSSPGEDNHQEFSLACEEPNDTSISVSFIIPPPLPKKWQQVEAP